MTPRTLAQMRLRPTAYEVVARLGDDATRLGFTERRTRGALLRMAQQHGPRVLAMLGDWDGEATYARATGWSFGPVRVCYSGRTERDCAAEQEVAS